MLLAKNGIIPPKEYEHDPLLYNFINNTVAIIFA